MRTMARARAIAARATAVRPLRWLWAARAELLTSLALLAGWALVTAFVAALTRPAVWLLSAGVLCLGAAGFRVVGRLLWDGLYALSREEDGHA